MYVETFSDYFSDFTHSKYVYISFILVESARYPEKSDLGFGREDEV